MTTEEFESVIMRALLDGEDPILDILREQWAMATLHKREFTGTGAFVFFFVPDSVMRCPKTNFTFGDLRIHLERMPTHAEATLTIRDGLLNHLDYFVYDGEFPSDPEIVSLDYWGPSFSVGAAGQSASLRDLCMVHSQIGVIK